MATLSTGPFLVPNFTQNSFTPCNTLFVLLSNSTNETLYVKVQIDQVVIPPIPVPPMEIVLPAKTVKGINHPLFMEAGSTSANSSASGGPRVLIVTVSGDVEQSGGKVKVSVTGGFSSNGRTLDFSEATMFFRHEDFVLVDIDEYDESSEKFEYP